MKQQVCIIFCRCGAGISGDSADVISGELSNLDVHVFEIQDLCAFSVNEKGTLDAIAASFEKKIVVACYPRAVRNMLRQGGIEPAQFSFLNYRELTPQEILVKLQDEFRIVKGEARYQVLNTQLKVPAWFPVVDAALCSLCGKCARFCLFGVYRYDKKSLKVVSPLACKNNCPACGRTCPTSAIMFPRLDERTALAGAEPGIRMKNQGENSMLLLLNDRNRERKNILRHGVMHLAEQERLKAVEEIRAMMVNKDKQGG